MAKTQRPGRVQRYSGQFKLTAVRLSNTPGVQVKDVADALDVHPFVLSKWRREAREGTIQPDSPKQAKRFIVHRNRHRLHSALGYRSPIDYERAAA